FSLLNLTYPGLESVLQSVSRGDLEDAARALLRYYRTRTKSWALISHMFPWVRDIDMANDAVQLRFFNLGGAVQPRRVQFDVSIDWQHNPFWAKEKDAEWIWGMHRQPFWMAMA